MQYRYAANFGTLSIFQASCRSAWNVKIALTGLGWNKLINFDKTKYTLDLLFLKDMDSNQNCAYRSAGVLGRLVHHLLQPHMPTASSSYNSHWYFHRYMSLKIYAAMEFRMIWRDSLNGDAISFYSDLREAPKKITFLVARPLRGGLGGG